MTVGGEQVPYGVDSRMMTQTEAIDGLVRDMDRNSERKQEPYSNVSQNPPAPCTDAFPPVVSNT